VRYEHRHLNHCCHEHRHLNLDPFPFCRCLFYYRSNRHQLCHVLVRDRDRFHVFFLHTRPMMCVIHDQLGIAAMTRGASTARDIFEYAFRNLRIAQEAKRDGESVDSENASRFLNECGWRNQYDTQCFACTPSMQYSNAFMLSIACNNATHSLALHHGTNATAAMNALSTLKSPQTHASLQRQSLTHIVREWPRLIRVVHCQCALRVLRRHQRLHHRAHRDRILARLVNAIKASKCSAGDCDWTATGDE